MLIGADAPSAGAKSPKAICHPLNEGFYRYIAYTNVCPLKYNNIGYWTPKFGYV